MPSCEAYFVSLEKIFTTKLFVLVMLEKLFRCLFYSKSTKFCPDGAFGNSCIQVSIFYMCKMIGMNMIKNKNI